MICIIIRIILQLKKKLLLTKKDIEALEQIWVLAKAWDDNYNAWKSSVFKTLETRDMDDYAQSEFKKLVKLSRDFRVITHIKFLSLIEFTFLMVNYY